MHRVLITATLCLVSLTGCSSYYASAEPKLTVPHAAQLLAYGNCSNIQIPVMREAGTYYVYDQNDDKIVKVAYVPNGTGLTNNSNWMGPHDYSVYFVPAPTTQPTANPAK